MNDVTCIAWSTAWQSEWGLRSSPSGTNARLSGVFRDAESALDALARGERDAAIRRAVDELDSDMSVIVRKFFLEELSLEEASRPWTKSWGSRLAAQALAILRRRLRRAEYRDVLDLPASMNSTVHVDAVSDAAPGPVPREDDGECAVAAPAAMPEEDLLVDDDASMERASCVDNENDLVDSYVTDPDALLAACERWLDRNQGPGDRVADRNMHRRRSRGG
jgi:hypothetical protein